MKGLAFTTLALGIAAGLVAGSSPAPAGMTIAPGVELRLENAIVLEPPEVAGNRVGLRWSPSAHAGFLAYLVCRSTNNRVGPEECVEEFLAPQQTAYVDTVPRPGLYLYQIYEVVYVKDLGAFVWIGGNVQAATAVWGDLPDLQVAHIALVPSNPAPQQALTAHLMITNSGTAAGDIGQVAVWVRDSSWFPGPDDFATGGVLQAGQATNLIIESLPAPSCGTNTFRAVVDSANGTFESNENNNVATLDYVVAADAYPDFAVTEIVLTPPRPARGGTFSALVTVENRGTLGADGGWLDVWAHRVTNAVFGEMGDISTNIGFLAPSQSRGFLFSGLIAPTGGAVGVFRAFADSQATPPIATATITRWCAATAFRVPA